MCVLLGGFPKFPVDPYYEPLAWFMILSNYRTVTNVSMISEAISLKAIVHTSLIMLTGYTDSSIMQLILLKTIFHVGLSIVLDLCYKENMAQKSEIERA